MLWLDQVFSEEAANALRDGVPLEPPIGNIEDMATTLAFIQEQEKPMRKEMERLACSIVFGNFQIFLANKPHVKVKAKLVDYILPPDKGEDVPPPKFRPELMDEYRKRKTINMMTQGAGICTHGIHHLRDDFKGANADLVRAYDLFDRLNMAMIRGVPDEVLEGVSEGESETMRILGEVRVEFKSGSWVIHAQALLMPVLVHEIIKGMYELIGMYGLPEDKAEEVMEYTDSKRNELLDIKYGDVLYGKVRDFIRENFYDRTDQRPEIFEYWLQELYQRPAREMIGAVEDVVLGRADLRGARRVIDDIYRDLQRDDAGF